MEVDEIHRLPRFIYHRAAFGYDGVGRCVKRTVNGATMRLLYNDWNPIVELDGAGNRMAWNVYGTRPDEIVMRSLNWNDHLSYHSDPHGNVFTILDDGGNIAEKYTYDVFGKPKIMDWWGNERNQSSISNRFMYTGREYFPELGIYDYRHRMYHPGLGRFLQADPVGLQTEGEKLSAGQKALFSPGGSAPEAFSSSEMNLFRYCHNDPVNKTDPMGLKDEYDYPNPSDAAAARALIDRLIGMGGQIGARMQQIRDSNNRILFIPIQKDQAGWEKYNLPPREKGDTTNRTTPDSIEGARNGRPGTGSKVELDPNNRKDPAGNNRNPIEAAGHEGDHAAANDQGKRLSNPAEENRAREFQKLIREKLKEK